MQEWGYTYDWPIGTDGKGRWDPDAHVTLRAWIRGDDHAQGRRRLDEWFRSLLPCDLAPAGYGAVTGGVYLLRFGIGTDDDPLVVDIHSAGEDGVESVHTSSQDLVEVLDGLALDLRWEQLPLTW